MINLLSIFNSISPLMERPEARTMVYLLVALVGYSTWSLVYAFLLSPVKHVPGTFWSRVSSIPYRWAAFNLRRSAYAHGIIQKYGPIVVIAPDQVHTSDEIAMKTIYDRSSIKTSFYRNMGSWKGVVTTLGKLDYASAGPTRTNLIQCFQNKNLDVLVENIDSHVTQFIETMRDKARKGENVDGVIWFRLLALDIVTDVLWGEQTNLLGRAGDHTPVFLRRFFAFSEYNAMKSFIPGFDLFVRVFGTARWSRLRQDCLDMDITAREALARWEGKENKSHDRDVLSMLSNMEAAEKPQDRLNRADLPAYMVEMMAAGSSTTSHTAAFACWALAQNPDIQRKLRQEIFDIFPVSGDLDMRASQSSVYLDAVIKETMRLWPMIPGPLERFLGKSIEVDGLTIPPGVIASTSAHTSGQNAAVFPEPESWKPERWLETNERMKLNWTPFGYGSRICPGSNLAITELKYMLCAIFRNLRSIEPVGVGYEPIQLQDVFAARTKSGHCWLRFEMDSDKP